MTFDQIRSEVLERMSLSSTDASTRVGAAINRHYKRITSLLGMETTRYISKDVVMTLGVRTVTVSGVEKVDRVADITSQLRPLSEVSLHQMRSLEPTASEPQVWALSNTQAQSVVLMFDTFPTFAWTLRIDGWTTLTDLTGSGEPAFPASFHDILTWFVLAEELLRKEKSQLAAAYEQKAAGLLEDLRFHLADTHTRTLVQNSHPGGATGGSGQGGGGGAPGGAQYLTNIPPGTVVGRASDQGTGNSQPITTGPHLVMTGSVLDAVGYVDKIGTPAVNQIGYFTDADTLTGASGLFANTTGASVAITAPVYAAIAMTASGQPADGKVFHVVNQDGAFYILRMNDAGSYLGTMASLDRVGNLVVGGNIQTIGGQVAFRSTQIPSADPYTLDDYREGTWSPVWVADGGQSGQSYLLVEGWYVKKGKDVSIGGRLVLSALGTLSGPVRLGGLPFTSGVFHSPGSVHVSNFSGAAVALVAMTGKVDTGATTVTMFVSTTPVAALAVLQGGHMSNNFDIFFSGHYISAN